MIRRSSLVSIRLDIRILIKPASKMRAGLVLSNNERVSFFWSIDEADDPNKSIGNENHAN